MNADDWHADVELPTVDGRYYRKIDNIADLLNYKNCLVKVQKREAYGKIKYLSGGILNHVDTKLRYVYVRSLATHQCFCLQIPLCDFWVLPPAEQKIDEEIEAMERVLKIHLIE